MFFLSSIYSIDATYSKQLGRLVNDEPAETANVQTRLIDCGGPRVCIFAKKEIKSGEEICFDYGVKGLPWRKKVFLSISFCVN